MLRLLPITLMVAAVLVPSADAADGKGTARPTPTLPTAGTRSTDVVPVTPVRLRVGETRAVANRRALRTAITSLEPGASPETFHKADRTVYDSSFSYRDQVLGGLPVLGAQLVLERDTRGALVSVAGQVANDRTLPNVKLSSAAAVAVARPGSVVVSTKAVAYDPTVFGQAGSAVPAWDVTFVARDDQPNRWIISAVDGKVLKRIPTSLAFERRICQLGWGRPLRMAYWVVGDIMGWPCQGTVPKSSPDYVLRPDWWRPELARTEGQPASKYPEVNEVYELLGVADGYLKSHFGRDGWDGHGSPSVASVDGWMLCLDGPCRIANAYWDTDTNEVLMGRDMTSDDVTAHEYMHGVSNASVGFIPGTGGQTSALQESLSDMFGEVIDQRTDSGDNDRPEVAWLLGEDTFTGAGRSMADPTRSFNAFSSGNPDRLSKVTSRMGPHGIAGVTNKFFYLLAAGDTFNGQKVAGIGNDAAFAIVYRAMMTRLTPAADFLQFGWAVNQACEDLRAEGKLGATACVSVRAAARATEIA